MRRKFLVGAIVAWASLSLASHAADAWTLQTEEGGNVLFPAGGAKFQPMQRRADDSFKQYVANVEADSSDASRPRLRWNFPTRGEGEKNVIVMSLDAEGWAGGRCVSDAAHGRRLHGGRAAHGGRGRRALRQGADGGMGDFA